MKDVRYLPIITRTESCKLNVHDICYVYRSGRKLQFVTDNDVINTYGKMDDIEKLLGDDFCRCMSGCIVNMSRIIDMKHRNVYFDNDKLLELSRDPYILLKQRFNAYLIGTFGQYVDGREIVEKK